MLTHESKSLLSDSLSKSGLRSTPQRRHVFDVLLAQRDHPTADEVYARAKNDMASISLATVYNCLETLVGCGLIRQVNLEREPSRFCPNLSEHAHFHCKKSGRIYDIDISQDIMESMVSLLPNGYKAEVIELHYLGTGPNDKFLPATKT